MKMGKMKYRGTIVVDIDGVLADFESKFCEDFGNKNREMYKLETRYPYTDPELIKEYVNNPENYKDLAPIFGGLLFIRQAAYRGWNVTLVTSRGIHMREVTRNWLSKYGAVYHDLIFSSDKRETVLSLDRVYPYRPVAIVVDDSLEVLRSIPEKYCVAWEQPWNEVFYPSMRYDEDRMKLVICRHPSEIYVSIWGKAKE